MRLRVSDPALVPELLEFLHSRLDVVAEQISPIAALNRLVTDEFPDLDRPAYRLVIEAQRYLSAVQDLVARVLEEGGEARDFGVLAEDYLTAAITAPVAELAEVVARTVFDPGRPWVDAGAIVDVLQTYRPRRSVRTRPPEPAGVSIGDPLAVLEEERAQVTRRHALKAEQHLQGEDVAALGNVLRGAGWPAAAATFVELLALDADESQPYCVDLSDELIVDTISSSSGLSNQSHRPARAANRSVSRKLRQVPPGNRELRLSQLYGGT
jgi:hypothetical protein